MKNKYSSKLMDNKKFDINKFYIGDSFFDYEYFGCHKTEDDKFVFRVYAPKAKRVTLTGDFNSWLEYDLKKDPFTNVFEGVFDDVRINSMYKYRIYSNTDNIKSTKNIKGITKINKEPEYREHSDPYGFGMELRPGSASVVYDIEEFKFTDDEWMKNRDVGYDRPLNIYELHMGSWRTKEDGSWYTYTEIGNLLAPYLKENGYTHVELMPITEHPTDESWGYQNTCFFSPTSRYGSPTELMEMINYLHNQNIGVLLDFVPIHFAIDGYGLCKFDGDFFYEYPSDVGYSEWGSYNFNFGKGEVRSFLKSAANYWLEKYHFDGLRMDAISRGIFWMGEPERGVNESAIEFIKGMNSGLKTLHNGIMLVAEDSTNFLKVTAPVEYDGLGFDYKWDMGWMHDTLEFFQMHPMLRTNNIGKLTFSMIYFYNELYMLALSHDEVVHGKATIIQKMWGDYDEKFPQARLLYMYMYTHPGKKLNFMGNEFGQFREWDEKREQDWILETYPLHSSFNKYMCDLNHIYINTKALHVGEYNSECFKWHCLGTSDRAMFVYERGSDEHGRVLVAMNFSDVPVENYKINLGRKVKISLLINSDDEIYSGEAKHKSTKIKTIHNKIGTSIRINLPKFGGQIFRIDEK